MLTPSFGNMANRAHEHHLANLMARIILPLLLLLLLRLHNVPAAIYIHAVPAAPAHAPAHAAANAAAAACTV